MLHIKQIATNLLSNAVKYTESGNVTLSILKKESAVPNQIILCITVSDTGSGILQEAIPTLFDSFTRADLTSHRHIEGTGLGLAIVKKLTELMDGSIRVDSEYGVGSTFAVELPQAIAEEKHSEVQQKQTKTFVAPECKILVVDDNQENLTVMCSLLERTQLQVDTADSGRACVEAVQSKFYRVILMDYMMPEMDGVQTLAALRALPNFKTPVIALTANAVAGTEQLLLNAGFAAYATKPIAWGRLESLLMQCLPREQVTEIALERPDSPLLEKLRELLGAQLPRYGIDLDRAMDFFDGDLRQYQKTLALFLHNYPAERGRMEQLGEQGDFAALRFLVHALKSKAKNMGAERLFETAEHMELLCKEQEFAEAKSLMPYLLYLWERGKAGLMEIEQTLASLLPEERMPPPTGSPEESLRILPELIASLRRQPALDALEALLATEPEGEGLALLKKTREVVSSVSFDEAGRLFAGYITLREGGERNVSGSYFSGG